MASRLPSGTRVSSGDEGISPRRSGRETSSQTTARAFRMTRRPMIGLVAVAAAVTVALLSSLASPGVPTSPIDAGTGPPSSATTTQPPKARPAPGHEVFGFVPYWEMNDDIAEHVAKTPLTTLALFSVTHTKTGKIDTGPTGYKRITGAIGKQLIREAHDRGVAVQLVYTSFGTARNKRLLGSLKIQDATIDGLVALADRTRVDGINVDIEQLAVGLVPAYGAFVGRLRDALR